MKGLWTIIKKEFVRFFKDRRLVMTMFLPGVLIYVIYSLIGNFMYDFIDDAMQDGQTQSYTVACTYQSERLERLVMRNTAHSGIEIEFVTAPAESEAKEKVKEGEYAVYMVIPQDFDELVKTDREDVPQVKLFYNSGNMTSSVVYGLLTESFNQYEESLVNRFDVNPGMGGYDLSGQDGVEEIMGSIFSMIVPFLLIIFTIAGAVSVTPESIAGEKERGTIATILVTPVRRSFVALGKVIALSCFSMIGAVSSFLGLVLSLPTLMGGAMEGFEDMGVSINIFTMYSVGDILLLLLAFVSFVPMIVAILSVLSTLAKSVKEATSMTSAVMMVSMVVGMLSMLNLTELWVAFVPILNVASSISSVLSGAIDPIFLLITVGMNLVYVAIITFILAKLFDSEKIML